MNRIRGIVMLIAAALAIWKGWQIHRGETALMAYGLAILALALAAWHLTRKAPAPRSGSEQLSPFLAAGAFLPRAAINGAIIPATYLYGNSWSDSLIGDCRTFRNAHCRPCADEYVGTRDAQRDGRNHGSHSRPGGATAEAGDGASRFHCSAIGSGRASRSCFSSAGHAASGRG